MRSRHAPLHVLVRLAVAVVAITAVVGTAIAGAPTAGAIPPCPSEPLAGDDCDPPPPPPPPPPGPLVRQVVLHETDQHVRPAAVARLDEVLDRVAAPNRALQNGRTITIHLIPRDLDLTELSPWANLRGKKVEDKNPDDDYVETRSYDQLRGLAGCKTSLLLAGVGSEQLVAVPYVDGGYNSPGTADLASTLVHETGHLIECLLTPAQQTKLANLYDAAFERYPTKIVGRKPVYTVSTAHEYWAEGTAAWFEAGSDPSYKRSWLQTNDPGLYALLNEVYDVPPAPRFCQDVRATKVLSSAESFTGGAGQDVVVGSSGADTVDGREGDDILCGQSGDDTLVGGLGADRLDGAAGADEIHGGYSTTPGPTNDGRDVITGAAGDDELHGDSGNDQIDGGADDDKLYGEDGQDHLEGAIGDDYLDGGAQADKLWGSDGKDHLFGNADDDLTWGGNGDDSYDGGPGNDYLADDYFGGPDNHPQDIGDGNDRMNGGKGHDELSGSAGNDVLTDHYGTDQLFGGPGFDQLNAVDLAEQPPPKIPYGPDHLDAGGDGTNYCTADANDIVPAHGCFPPGEG